MDDRHAHFLIAVGNVCDDARLAALDVEVLMDDARRIRGVPSPVRGGGAEHEIDDTGCAKQLFVGDEAVDLECVVEIRLHRPVQAP